MMDDKYYTIELDDLLPGMECEILKDDKWNKFVVGDSKFLDFLKLVVFAKSVRLGEVRCKYLDQEDIEECGWKRFTSYNKKHIYGKDVDGHPIVLNVEKMPYIEIFVQTLDKNRISPIHERCAFSGYIKNKAELKRIMKMVGIDN